MIDERIKHQARLELARRDFWEFEKALYPELFTEKRKVLKEVANRLQEFVENDEKHFLVISLPPGFYKSFTAKNLAMWLMGRNPRTRIIGVSNSGDMAGMFSTQIRDTILGNNTGRGGFLYGEIFENTKIKYGYATKAKWELEGSSEPSYRATSPTSTLTGSRADVFIVDDIIKNAYEAQNEQFLNQHFDWFRNTLYSRADGNGYKFIFVMQRWATNDLVGRIIEHYGERVEVVNYAVENDGEMLDESILNKEKLDDIKKTLSPSVFKANYYQEPINIEGRLYKKFEEWEKIPQGKTLCHVDVADTGADYLSAIVWRNAKDENGVLRAWVVDVYYSNAKAEITENELSTFLTVNGVDVATFESNNGGRLYARNIERKISEMGNHKTVIKTEPQTKNKEARILASSAWIAENIRMPKGWVSRYADFANEVLSYTAGGKNRHDDGVDVLATIYEKSTAKKMKYASSVVL